MNQSMKSPLVTNMSDDVHVMNTSNDATRMEARRTGVTMYALGNIFKGEPLPTDVDLDTLTQACFRRVDSTIVNGPPITDPTGYIHVMSVYHEVGQESTAIPRIRQIVYPDNVNDPTPYTRVGYASTTTDTIEWSPWNTLGGNMIRRLLTQNIVSTNSDVKKQYALPNSMYESFGNWTLQLPSPSTFSLGTRIGLEQWNGHGSVIYKTGSDTYEQLTAPDIDINGNYIGGMIYLFEIVDAEGSTTANPIYEWKMDTLQNYDGVISALQLQLAEHRLADQTNVASVIRSSQSNSYVVPQTGYIYAKDANGNYLGTALRVNGTNNGAKIRAVNAGDIITFNGSVASSVTVTFTPDEHAMYLRDDELNSSWHDKSALDSQGGRWSTSVHLKGMEDTPASTKAVVDLEIYVDQRDNFIIDLVSDHTGSATKQTWTANRSDFAHPQYVQWSKVVNTYNVAKNGPSKPSDANIRTTYYGEVASAKAVYDLYNSYTLPNFNAVNARLTDHTGSSTSTTWTVNTNDAAHRQYIPWSQVVNTYSTSYTATSTGLPAEGVNNTNGKIASAKAVYDLYVYANGHISQSAYGSNDVHKQYMLKRELIQSYHSYVTLTSSNISSYYGEVFYYTDTNGEHAVQLSTSNGSNYVGMTGIINRAPSINALNKLASKLQSKGLLYGAARNNGNNAVDLDTLITTGIYDVQSCTNGPTQDGGGVAQRSTVIVITESTISGSATAAGGQNETVLVQILISKDSYNNMWYRTRYGSTTWYPWTRFAKTKRTFPVTSAGTITAATIQAYLQYCEPTIECKHTTGTVTVNLPAPSSVMDGCRVNVEVHDAGTANIVWGTYSYAATLTNGNPTYIPLESDGSSWYMICVG